jgi:uncharacterized protein
VISVDTNILLYAFDSSCGEHAPAFAFLESLADRDDVLICELVLVELYVLVRNPAVVRRPLGAGAARNLCEGYRRNSRWGVIDYPGSLMPEVWRRAGAPTFARRRIFDVRLALTLIHHGVTELATRNTRDFEGLGLSRVWDPLS